LHELGGVLFSAHMSQQELLMVVAAPLIVGGQLPVAFAWALGGATTSRLAQSRIAHAWAKLWPMLTAPLFALVVHVAVLFVWHMPLLYQLTLRSDSIHAVQHASFFVSAMAFWWGLLRARRSNIGAAIVYLFVAMIATGMLGAFLTFASRLWYPAYATTSRAWGLDAIDDQRLGGLIMWIPGGASYLIAAMWLVATLLREPTERRNPSHRMIRT
jgi:putative membrane protein